MSEEEELMTELEKLHISSKDSSTRRIVFEDDINANLTNDTGISVSVDIESLCTKEKRLEVFGKCSGGRNSMKPENFQREFIVRETGADCGKVKTRINLRTNQLNDVSTPNKNDNGFDYTENFDGIQVCDNVKIYVNLKNVVGRGGSQTRTLREVYWFIQGQLNVLRSLDEKDDTYFANVIDGDVCEVSMKHFKYLCNLDEYKNVNKKVFVGNSKNYIEWFKKLPK
jgi:hypothetical protein